MARGKERLDKLLVDRGLAPSRSKGQAQIMAGEVRVDGELVTKAGQQVPLEAEISIAEPMPYASRGGFKLAGALDLFDLDVSGAVCADVGACTGGFSDVLLQHGAARVYAIDVGYGQLDWNLRNDERVVVMERTNARHLDSLAEPVEFVCIDVSFISLRLILPAVRGWLAPDGMVVALIKPQFEAGRAQVGKGGIVRNPQVHRQVLEELLDWSVEQGWSPAGLIRSPITGSGGNIEFLVWLRSDGEPAVELAAVVDRLVDNTGSGD